MGAKGLTKYENHRTDTEYEDSLIMKIFLFEVTNSYLLMYYIAFVAQNIKASRFCSSPDDCSMNLLINLALVMCAKCFGQNVGEAIRPIVMRNLKHVVHSTKGHGGKPMSKAEEEFLMHTYDPIHEMILDYREIGIIFGFVILFTVVFPIGPLIAFLGFYIELRVDAFKMLEQQRPIPRGAQDIGTWMVLFKFFVGASIITNSALICFRSHVLGTRDVLTKTWIFNASQYVLFGLMLAMEIMIPDVPKDVRTQLKRQAHIVSKVIRKDPDEAEDRVMVSPHAHKNVRLFDSEDGEDDPNGGQRSKTGPSKRVSLRTPTLVYGLEE